MNQKEKESRAIKGVFPCGPFSGNECHGDPLSLPESFSATSLTLHKTSPSLAVTQNKREACRAPCASDEASVPVAEGPLGLT